MVLRIAFRVHGPLEMATNEPQFGSFNAKMSCYTAIYRGLLAMATMWHIFQDIFQNYACSY